MFWSNKCTEVSRLKHCLSHHLGYATPTTTNRMSVAWRRPWTASGLTTGRTWTTNTGDETGWGSARDSLWMSVRVQTTWTTLTECGSSSSSSSSNNNNNNNNNDDDDDSNNNNSNKNNNNKKTQLNVMLAVKQLLYVHSPHRLYLLIKFRFSCSQRREHCTCT